MADLARLLRQFSHFRVDFTVAGLGPTAPARAMSRANAPSSTVTWWCSISAASSTVTAPTPRAPHVGEPSTEEQNVHDLVRAAQSVVCAAVPPGIACQEADRPARAVIDEAGYGT